jgi:hypothetical protein
MRAGLFLDPDTGRMNREGRAKLMEVFRLGSWENLAGTDELQRSAAQCEHAELEKGVIPRIGELDDHALHLAEHTRFALSSEFKRMEQHAPRLARALMMHARGHRMMAEDAQRKLRQSE